MGFSPLTNTTLPMNGRFDSRKSRILGFTVHHQAGVNAQGMSQDNRYGVSANYWISNDGTIIGNIDEIYRAWTTGFSDYPAGAQSDHRNITVEVSNSPEGFRNGTWAISEAAMNSLIRLIADCARRHGFAVVRGTHGGIAVHQDFMPTTCPGPYIMSNLGAIISAAAGGGPAPGPTPSPSSFERASGGDSNAPMWPRGALMSRIQSALKARGRYNGPVDGVGGTNTAKGIQLTIANGGGYTGPIDGALGRQSALAVQRYATRWGDYTGPIDGDPLTNSWANFALGLERP